MVYNFFPYVFNVLPEPPYFGTTLFPSFRLFFKNLLHTKYLQKINYYFLSICIYYGFTVEYSSYASAVDACLR